MPKYSRYQDYVIKDGKLVGEFEQMYQDYQDPWEQTSTERYASERAVAVNIVNAMGFKTVMELGCGLGHFTRQLKAGAPGAQLVGVDISPTALEQARANAPGCTFVQADILDFDVYRKHNPDLIIMAEITWYVLEKLPAFLEFLKKERPQTHLLHLLTLYPPGEQQYGKDHFTTLDEIRAYYRMNYAEYGEITKPHHGDKRRSYFLGRYAPLGPNPL